MKKTTQMTESELEICFAIDKLETRFSMMEERFKYMVERQDKIEAGEGKMNLQLTLILEQIRMNHDREMKRIDLEILRQNHELQMKIAEFQENRDAKRRESAYSESLKTESLKVISDIGTAVAEGMTAKYQKHPFWKFWR